MDDVVKIVIENLELELGVSNYDLEECVRSGEEFVESLKTNVLSTTVKN